MPIFFVEKAPQDEPAFRVLGPDRKPAGEIQEFLIYLSNCGRSAYTIRSYATGLAHFFDWLHERGTQVDAVTRTIVGHYIGAFGRTPKHRPGTRQPPESQPAQKDGGSGVSRGQRRARTINHRLSVLASYFEFCIRRDLDNGGGAWFQRPNPVSPDFGGKAVHRAAGRDAPVRRRAAEFRRRVPREIHQTLDPATAQHLISAAISCRDKCILTLLFRTGQRIGDWNDLAGRHGLLGMELVDIDESRRTITVRLKGNRDEHRVPVTDDFWPLFHRYLADERGMAETTSAAWLAVRKGKGKPLSYTAFESSIRYISRKVGAAVHPHMFRHTLAQAVLETTGNLKVAQELLGHAQLTTTADLYMHVDESAMVKALATVKSAFDHTNNQAGGPASSPQAERYAFGYDEITILELEKAVAQPKGGTGEKDL